MDAEKKRLDRNSRHEVFWKKWGPYLSERQWGTVREDYSESGDAWNYLPHDHARFKAYRWGEDGIAGISDIYQHLCFAPAFWNGRDPILKERLFGVNSTEGNHGEDVKELYYYLDNTPTHSYMKYLYKYPQQEYPYNTFARQKGNKTDPEFELIDTGIFNNNEYFDIFIEYAKAAPEDIHIRITIYNRGDKAAPLWVLPTIWFRNTWNWSGEEPPVIRKQGNSSPLTAVHKEFGTYYLYHNSKKILITDNETNKEKLYGVTDSSPYTKDLFHDLLIKNRQVVDRDEGTKAAISCHFNIPGGGKESLYLRLTANPPGSTETMSPGEIFDLRKREADEFYGGIISMGCNPDEENIQRQAFASLLWSKQFYNYELETWLEGDPGTPPPPESRKSGRNAGWLHLFNRDVISMPDKWEYPWYATWDLAFHCVTFALVDPDFAKKQLLLFLREWYMHPNGQIPAYEWELCDVNPPVHAWAAYRVYQIEKEMTGQGDYHFLERVFHKLLLNFTWWVNRKDREGHNIFQGGFLGLDNIGVFDRSKPLPTGGQLEQADGTSWMAMYSLNMMTIALELARETPSYEDVASKFFEHFIHIAEAFNAFGKYHQLPLWNEEDGFFYDLIHFSETEALPLKIRSMVGLIPLFAASVFPISLLDEFPGFAKRLKWFRNNRQSLNKQMFIENLEGEEYIFLSLVKKERLVRIFRRLFDENEFLSKGGIRSLSKYHLEHPFILSHGNKKYCVNYQPAESDIHLFGGNSNWRGPVWMPVNYLLIHSLLTFSKYFKESLQIEFPSGSGDKKNLEEAATELARRIIWMFKKNHTGHRPVNGSRTIYRDRENFQDLVLFYEYFNGDTSEGLGASHQTGWTALIANLIRDFSGSVVCTIPRERK